MTTTNHQIINYCPDCEEEYVGGHCAPMPSLRAEHSPVRSLVGTPG